jgi:hypothetical protein
MNANIIYKYGLRSYDLILLEPKSSLLLAMFLTDDVGGCAKSFITWFEDPAHNLGSSNATQYSVDDGMVTFTPEWKLDYEECIAKGNYFQIPFDLLMQLLHQWEIVYKQKPPYITVVVTDDTVSVTGSDTMPEERQY